MYSTLLNSPLTERLEIYKPELPGFSQQPLIRVQKKSPVEGKLQFLLLLWYSRLISGQCAVPDSVEVGVRSAFKITAMNNNECSLLRRRTPLRNDARTMTFARRHKKTPQMPDAERASPARRQMRKSAQ